MAVAALPAGEDDSTLRGALRAAAAAAADAPAGAPFTGYRHIVERVRFEAARLEADASSDREVWVNAQWRGVERIDAGGGARPETIPLAARTGPFGQAPLAKLPTDPDALLRALTPPTTTAATRRPARRRRSSRSATRTAAEPRWWSRRPR